MSVRTLFGYWNERREDQAAPTREAIEPGPIRGILADTFILGYDARAGHPFRLAGTRICSLFCRELKGSAFADIWTERSRPLVKDILQVVSGDAIAISAAATGHASDGASIELELLLLPLLHEGRLDTRVLGALAPAVSPYWVGAVPLVSLTLGPIGHVGISRNSVQAPAAEPAPEEAAPEAVADAPGRPGARIRRGFVVYDGGQSG